MLKLKIN